MRESLRLSADERLEIVAYLDGEAPPEVASQIEAKINQSVSARLEVEALRKTWDVLDYLPRPPARPDFTSRTMTMAAQRGERAVESGRTALSWARTALMALLWLAGVAAFLLIGYLGMSQAPDRHRRLLQDLPVLERLEEYRAAKDIDFLRALRELRELDDITPFPATEWQEER